MEELMGKKERGVLKDAGQVTVKNGPDFQLQTASHKQVIGVSGGNCCRHPQCLQS